MDRKPKALDLFCGCGGMSVGLRSAGFNILAGIDVEPNYIWSFSRNFPGSRSLVLDLSAVIPSEFMNYLGLREGELDLLAGGPPCQGFSKNVPRRFRYLEDPNNLLIRTFLNFCESLRPQSVLMENVAEMRNGFSQTYSEEVLQRLNDLGYSVIHAVLNAADYGVPQRRRRAFFLATRDGISLSVPNPTHTGRVNGPELFQLPSYVRVWDAIGDLPSIKHGEGQPLTEYGMEPFSDFQRLVRNGQRVVANHVARRLQPKQYARLAALSPGQALKDLPPHLRVRAGYSGAYGRLTKEMIAPTITRWMFHPGSGRWGHPIDVRTLTIREAARIQGFPDSFEFIGTYNQQAGQVGNAVPPLLIQRIAGSMMRYEAISS